MARLESRAICLPLFLLVIIQQVVWIGIHVFARILGYSFVISSLIGFCDSYISFNAQHCLLIIHFPIPIQLFSHKCWFPFINRSATPPIHKSLWTTENAAISKFHTGHKWFHAHYPPLPRLVIGLSRPPRILHFTQILLNLQQLFIVILVLVVHDIFIEFGSLFNITSKFNQPIGNFFNLFVCHSELLVSCSPK